MLVKRQPFDIFFRPALPGEISIRGRGRRQEIAVKDLVDLLKVIELVVVHLKEELMHQTFE